MGVGRVGMEGWECGNRKSHYEVRVGSVGIGRVSMKGGLGVWE